jgi:hypothetical protein
MPRPKKDVIETVPAPAPPPITAPAPKMRSKEEGELYIAAIPQYIGGIKGKIAAGTEVLVKGNRITVNGEEYVCPSIHTTIRNKHIIRPGEEPPELRPSQPPNYIITRKDDPKTGRVVESVLPIEHDSGVASFEFRKIPMRGVELLREHEPNFNYDKWNKLSSNQKVSLLVEVADLQVLNHLAEIEIDPQVKQTIEGRVRLVKEVFGRK